ncbi:DAK2 domain-containing protein [Rhizobium miluonense]|uniref:DAK2 domain-containing protein n=1 Tax=Rhizobium miluonense TaxID=411945 RepID=A0A1C3WEK2_9HYPH|nr:DAK2 domain-containing protein [Rhizobium miluonense]
MLPIAAPMVEADETFHASRDDRVRAIAEMIIATCIGMEGAINALDAKVGDGDTGSTFAGAARTVQAAIDTLPFADGSALLSALSDLKRKAMGGSSGVLFAIMMARSADAYRQVQGLGCSPFRGPGSDAAIWRSEAWGPDDDRRAFAGARGPRKWREGMASAAAAALLGADATASMTRANAGRSSYLDARSLEGIADPGAEAIARIFEALAALPG